MLHSATVLLRHRVRVGHSPSDLLANFLLTYRLLGHTYLVNPLTCSTPSTTVHPKPYPKPNPNPYLQHALDDGSP